MENQDSVARLGDTSEGLWLSDVFNNCLKISNNKWVVDMNLLVSMCRSEPKCALVAIQVLAYDLEERDTDENFSNIPEDLSFIPLLVGSIAMAYIAANHLLTNQPIDQCPEEMVLTIHDHPVIEKCIKYVTNLNLHSAPLSNI